MATQMVRNSSPSFAVVLRGYDKDEVDDYLESLRHNQGDVDVALEKAQKRERLLSVEVRQLAHRVADLETCLRSETPRSADALGERLALMLREAEAAANETVQRAEVEAETILADSRQQAEALLSHAERTSAESEALASSAARRADEIADRLRSEAQFKADAIIRDAEARVEAKVTQVEEWAREVRARIGAEQLRAAEHRASDRAAHQAEIDEMVGVRANVSQSLLDLVDLIHGALGMPSQQREESSESVETVAQADADEPAQADVESYEQDEVEDEVEGEVGESF